MQAKRDAGIPKFHSLEEEREYWEARGPLAEGHKGRANRPKSGEKRSSFLAVRLTGEELAKLRDIAARQGIGPSTFARLVLTRAIEQNEASPSAVTLDELISKLASAGVQVIVPERVAHRRMKETAKAPIKVMADK